MCSDPVTSHSFQPPHPSAAAFTSRPLLCRSLAAPVSITPCCTASSAQSGAPPIGSRIMSDKPAQLQALSGAKGECHCSCNLGNLSDDAWQQTVGEQQRGNPHNLSPGPASFPPWCLSPPATFILIFTTFIVCLSQLDLKSSDSKAFVLFLMEFWQLPGIKEALGNNC